jgi:glutamate-1-semialdehyde aminotransferase
MPGFLEGVRELCNRYQTVLVFDEIITGFRWARAGGQEYFGVVPDLATFGKAAANGLPIAFLCGKKHFMRHAELVQGGTFGGDALSLAACNAVLDVYEKEPIIDTLWTRGAALQKSFNQAAKDVNVEAVCSGFPCKPRIDFFPYTESKAHDDGRRKRFAMSLFLQEAAAAGVLFHPVNCNVSAVLSEEDMKATSRAIKTALRAVARALKDDDWSALMGQPIQPVGPLRT